jgi:predicted ATPase/DNA-binding SARP family transcriptional activator
MRVDTVGLVAVHGPSGTVSGAALGGRRARVAMVALAFADGPLSAERLATMIWAGDPPPSWHAALRGVVRSLRTAVGLVGVGTQQLISTVPTGYVLGSGVVTDVAAARESLGEAVRLLGDGRFREAAESAAPAARLDGTALLGDEDLGWLDPYRAAIAQTRMRALAVLAEAADGLGDSAAAVGYAQSAVVFNPMDEPAHRTLIRMLDRAGDRAGVVLAYERCRTLLAEELGVDPSRETVDAYLSAMHDNVAAAHAPTPVKTNSFLGREAELAELIEMAGAPGLICVTGRGGVGKSRLAAEVTKHVIGPRLWVSLAPVTDDALVPSAVAVEIGAQIGTQDPMAVLQAHLAPLGRVLLVLDGADTVVDGVTSMIADLIATCPTLTVLVTCRQPVRLAGDRAVTIRPLSLPPGTDHRTLADSTIGRMLMDRVGEAGGDFRLDAGNAPLIAALCRRCAGLPLAIELVGAQLAQVSPQDLLEDLPEAANDGLDALRSVVRHSLSLLDVQETAVFRRFAVLNGPVNLPLIRSVVADADIAPTRVVRILRELTERHLLSVDRSTPRWRYTQDDDLHTFADELLIAAGERIEMLTRLSGAVLALLPADARMPPAVDDVTEQIGSVRTVLSAALSGEIDRDLGMRLAFGLHRFWAETDVSEGRFWLSRLLDTDDESPHAGYARFGLGYLSYWSGDALPAIEQLELAVRALRDVDDGYTTRALIYLGGLADDMDRGTDAVAFVRESIERSERLGQPNLHVATTVGMGSVLAERDDPAAARYAAQAVELCRTGGSTAQLSLTLPTAAMICWQVGALDDARAYLDEGTGLLAGVTRIASVVLKSAAAGIAFADGDMDAAVELATIADRDGTALGVDRELPLIRCILSRALFARGESGRAAAVAASAIAAARAISYLHPLATCLETVVVVAAATSSPADLASLLAYADEIRSQGERPGVGSLRDGVDEVRSTLPTPDRLLTATEAAALATDVIARIDAVS